MSLEGDSSTNKEPKQIESENTPGPREREEKPSTFGEALREEIQKAKETNDKAPRQERSPKQDVKTAESETVEPILPPSDMSAEEKAYFEKLDPASKRYLSRRAYELRADYARQTTPIREKAKEFEALEAVIGPVKNHYAKQGVAIPDLVRRAIAWDQDMARDKINTARDWLATHGVDPYELIDSEESGQRAQQPQVQTFGPEDIQRQIAEEVERRIQSERHELTTRNNMTEVQKFIESKPLFRDPNTATQLEAEMAPVVKALSESNPSLSPAERLERAYKMVVATNDNYSRVLNAYTEREKADKARAETEKAQRASRSISGGIAGANPQRGGLDFREELRLRMNGSI